MDAWPEGEIRKLSHVWKDADDHYWLAVFDMANLAGRVECVGVALRSSLGPYGLACDPDLVDPDNPLWPFVDPLPGSPDHMFEVEPRRIHATTLRFRFAEVLREARQAHAKDLRIYAEQEERSSAPWLDPAELREAAAMYDPSAKKLGRPPKYGHAFLRQVAIIYQQAWREGEEPPSKVVARELSLKPTTARKQVARCRGAGLLPPTERRKARGWYPGEPNPLDRPEDGPSR